MMLLQTALDVANPAGGTTSLLAAVVSLGVLFVSRWGVDTYKERRQNGAHDKRVCWGREHPGLIQDAASHTKDIHEIVMLKSDGRPLVYHERGVKDAVIELAKGQKEMETNLVAEIRTLTAAVKKNGAP